MPTKYALDCEMVESGNKSMLASVSIVDEYGRVIIDTFVKPTDVVTDYRVFITGITREDLENGVNINVVRDKVRKLLRGCILVGHSLHFDLAALRLEHPIGDIRDLAKYEPFTRRNGQPIALKRLAREYLRKEIQTGQHCSIEDARASMAIYKVVEYEWEESIREEHNTQSQGSRNTCHISGKGESQTEDSSLSKIAVAACLFALVYFVFKP